MKKILLLGLLLGASAANSQDVVDVLAKETCECIDAKKLDIKSMASADLKSEFVSCFFKAYSARHAEVDKVEKLDMQNEEQMTKFGERVAIKMINHCPNVLIALGTAFNEEEAMVNQVLTVEGEVTDIRTEQFVTISVKDKNARVHNFLLLDYFESAALFTDNQIVKKDRIAVDYTEIEMYDPKLREFRYFKIISGLQKK